MNFVKLYVFIVVGIMQMFVQASELDTLLNDFNNKNALSQKTIDENKGHLVLYSRDKLERMHANTLKDVFKTTPVLYYHENRYAQPDPLTSGSFEPYRSNFIRMYIDGVEVTQGWMGSGIVLYGDINIDFVDHIEFYYMTPSFETTTEPAFLTIFLYSKEAERDSGGAVSLASGSRGTNTQTLSYGNKEEDFSYMVNLSHTDAKREKIPNGTSKPLSRDFELIQLFSYIKSENQVFHLQVMKKNVDSLAGLSLDATPLVSEIDYLNIHVDYGITFGDYWKAQFAYEYLDSDIRQEDDNPFFFGNTFLGTKFHTRGKNSTVNADLTYKNTLGHHRVATGIKYRVKRIDAFDIIESSLASNLATLSINFDNEAITSLFFQDQYQLEENQLLTLGLEYSNIRRNGGVSDDELFQVRLGYLYSDEKWSYKTYIYRSMFALEPFGRYIHLEFTNSVKPQVTRGVTQEISYRSEKSYTRFMALFMKDNNGLLENNRAGDTKYFFSILNYNYNFDMNTVMDLQLYYARYEDIFNLDKLEDYSGYVSFSNTYEDWSFYNGVVWHQNSIDHKNYFDLTSSISWDATRDLTLTLKGDNLLNKAKTTKLFRIDPLTGAGLKPFDISPIDQSITLEVEYRF